MTPSLEQLRILLAAAETGSFSAAARKLGKAQSVVSSAIANTMQATNAHKEQRLS